MKGTTVSLADMIAQSDAVSTDAVAVAISETVRAIVPAANAYGARPADIIRSYAVANDAAGALVKDGTPTVRLTGARAKDRDTAADRLFDDILAADGGALRLIPVRVDKGANGRAKNNGSTIETALDKAYLRLARLDQDRIIYGRADDVILNVDWNGIEVQTVLPGVIYVMATGGAVKSHPVMGKIYRAITGARKG